jgi:mRNA-degrading endonuclease RelE of RelBE toxin-antitoxin system
LSEWEIRTHPSIYGDLEFLGKRELEIFYKKKQKIRENPLRQKHLRGGENCYREPITENIRLIYYIQGKTIWLLTVGPHKKAYLEYVKRLYAIKQKLGIQ